MQPCLGVGVWPARVWRPSPCLTAARFGGKGCFCPPLLDREDGSANALSAVMLMSCREAAQELFLEQGSSFAREGPSYPLQGPQGPWQMLGQRHLLHREGTSASIFPALVFQGLLELAVASNRAVN